MTTIMKLAIVYPSWGALYENSPFAHMSWLHMAGLALLCFAGLVFNLFLITWWRRRPFQTFLESVGLLLISFLLSWMPPAALVGVILSFCNAAFSEQRDAS